MSVWLWWSQQGFGFLSGLTMLEESSVRSHAKNLKKVETTFETRKPRLSKNGLRTTLPFHATTVSLKITGNRPPSPPPRARAQLRAPPRRARFQGPKMHNCTPQTGANLHKCTPTRPAIPHTNPPSLALRPHAHQELHKTNGMLLVVYCCCCCYYCCCCRCCGYC